MTLSEAQLKTKLWAKTGIWKWSNYDRQLIRAAIGQGTTRRFTKNYQWIKGLHLEGLDTASRWEYN